MGYVWIFFVSGAFVILRPVSLPITKTHPTEVVFTMVTLHMIATPVFLNANVALRALKKEKLKKLILVST